MMSTTTKKCKEHIIQRGVIRADHHHPPIDNIDIVSRSYHNITTSSSYIISNVMYDASSYAYNTTLKSILLPLLTTIQRIVNAILATLLLLSCIQAIVALYQYRYDVRGQLVKPDGLTIGREDYYYHDNVPKNLIVGAQEEEVDDTSSTMATSTASNKSWTSQLLMKLNKSLVLLLPWMTRNIHSVLTGYTHLFHIGCMAFMLDSLLPLLLDGDKKDIDTHAILEGDNILSSSSSSLRKKMMKEVSADSKNDPLKVLVLGDSLAIGIGCVEKFDAKTNIPFKRIENLAQKEVSASKSKTQQQQGPVFPQVLARTLSYHMKRPVEWRSAGVNGGSVTEIQSYCLDVVKQESLKGDIDVVVVLFGMNDLKKLLSVFDNVEGNEEGILSQFRKGMDMLISDIHSYSPEAVVVFPMIPVQPFHKNSIINIFPLGLVVDTALGIWERQKWLATNRNTNAMYIDLKAAEIAKWYTPRDKDDENEENENTILLSGDGVHPNKLMYAKWAGLVGKKLYNNIVFVSTGRKEQIDLGV